MDGEIGIADGGEVVRVAGFVALWPGVGEIFGIEAHYQGCGGGVKERECDDQKGGMYSCGMGCYGFGWVIEMMEWRVDRAKRTDGGKGPWCLWVDGSWEL